MRLQDGHIDDHPEMEANLAIIKIVNLEQTAYTWVIELYSSGYTLETRGSTQGPPSLRCRRVLVVDFSCFSHV